MKRINDKKESISEKRKAKALSKTNKVKDDSIGVSRRKTLSSYVRWTTEDDDRLISALREYGRDLDKIVEIFPNRSVCAIDNRLKYKFKKLTYNTWSNLKFLGLIFIDFCSKT